MQDEECIAKFVDEDDQNAFRAVVSRYSPMVYSVCIRELGDRSMAEDASQAVFITLARKAHTLRRRAALPRWLFHTALFVVANMKRDEKLRKKREKEAALMYGNSDTNHDEELLEKINTHLNGMINSLGSRHKDAVLRCFIQGKSQKETAAELGCSEDAVRMRISRALEKMRKLLKKKGVPVPAAVLTGFLTQKAVEAAPAGLAGACHTAAMAALAGNAAAFSKALLLSEGVIKMMMWAKLKTAAVVVAAAAVVSTGVPVAVNMAKAAETVREKGTAPSAVEESPLVWKEIGKPEFYSQYHPSTGKESKAYAVWRDSKSYRSGWSVRYIARSEKNLEQYPAVDFESKMAVAVWRTLFGPKYSLEIDCVVETESEVRVKYKADCILKPPPGGRMRSASPFQCLIEVERREKPVVFYENGKKVAEVLPFRRITGPFWYGDTAYRKISSGDDLFKIVTRYYGASSKDDSDKQKWLNEMRNWVDAQKIDFKKEMILAAFQGPVQGTSDAGLCITHAAVINGKISITLKRIPGLTEGGVSYPFDIIACPRRDLPAIFYENGKEVARLASGKAEISNADIPVAEVLGFSPDGADLAVLLNTWEVAVAPIGKLWENPRTCGIRILGTLPPPASMHRGIFSKWKPDRAAIAVRWVEPAIRHENAVYTVFNPSGKGSPKQEPCTQIDAIWHRTDLEYRIGNNGLEKRAEAGPAKYRTAVTNKMLNRKLQDNGWKFQRVLNSAGKAVWLEAVKYLPRQRIGKSLVPRSLKILIFENGNLNDIETYTETAVAVKSGIYPIKVISEDGQNALVYYHSSALHHFHSVQTKPGNSTNDHVPVLVRLSLSEKPQVRPFEPKNPFYSASSIRLLSVSPRADRMIVITRTYRHMIRRYQTKEQVDEAKKRLGCRIVKYWGKTPAEAMEQRRRMRREPGSYYSGEWKLMFPVLRFWRISFDKDEPEPLSPPITFGPEAPKGAYLTQLPFAHSRVYPLTQHPKGLFCVLPLKSADPENRAAKLLVIKLPSP